MKLLPIGTRVTHFDGGSSTHGSGTIIDYNGVKPNSYLQEKPAEAIQMAGEARMLDILISSFYDGARCPYVVHFDPSEGFPEGYKDVYETESVREII